jgi:hypothetical protein
MVLGWFFVRPIPLPAPSGVNTLENGLPAPRSPSSPWRSYFERGDDSGTRLLPDNELDNGENYVRSPRRHARAVSIASCGEVVASAHPEDEQPDISGRELLTNIDFLLLFTVMSLRESPDET